MISNIVGGPGIVVSSSSSSPYINSNTPIDGMLRYNGSDLEVYDGNCWLRISQTFNVELDSHTSSIVSWAQRKMLEEHQLQERLKNNPALAHAWEQFKILDILTQEVKST